MMGCFGPKPEVQEFVFPMDQAPAGLLSRGHFDAKMRVNFIEFFTRISL